MDVAKTDIRYRTTMRSIKLTNVVGDIETKDRMLKDSCQISGGRYKDNVQNDMSNCQAIQRPRMTRTTDLVDVIKIVHVSTSCFETSRLESLDQGFSTRVPRKSLGVLQWIVIEKKNKHRKQTFLCRIQRDLKIIPRVPPSV